MFVATLLIYGNYYGIFGSIAIIMVNYGKNMETIRGFLYGSVGKESACNTGDLSSIPASGRSAGEGNGNPFQAVFVHGKFHGQRSLVWTEEPGGL